MKKRLVITTLIIVGVILGSLGIISYRSVEESITRSHESRVKLSKIIANYTDTLLRDNLARLYDISLSGAVNFGDGTWEPEIATLRTVYQYSIFTDGIFLLDLKGNVVVSYPRGNSGENLSAIPQVNRALLDRKPAVSNIYTDSQTMRSVIYVLVPVMDATGNIVGLAGGQINPTNYTFNRVMQSIPAGKDTFVELVDENGVVIASNNQSRVFKQSDHDGFLKKLIDNGQSTTARCHHCHEGSGAEESEGDGQETRENDILAFSPLEEAGWGVCVREPEESVFAPSTALKRRFLILGAILLVSAFIFSFGLTNVIVKPITSLTSAAQRIASGNLNEPVRVRGRDEIGILSRDFELMRRRLKKSLTDIQRYNQELEERVARRTAELEKNKKRLSFLLQDVITAQEDERKRIARELHDETSQSLAALGMSVDIAAIAHSEGKLSEHGIAELKNKLNQILDGINLLIRDLRPPVLDDLGLESAVSWLLEKHLKPKGIAFKLSPTPEFRAAMADRTGMGRAGRKSELTLFRMIQEAVINIAKHSGASSVLVYIDAKEGSIDCLIEDDGEGFDVGEALRAAERGENRGFGIIGMQERALMLGGKVTICSCAGCGTLLRFRCSLSSLEA